MSDEIAKDPLGRSIHMPPMEKVDANWENMERLLRLIAIPMEWDEDALAQVFVSDMSPLGHFCLEEEARVQLCKELGFDVNDEDLLVEIAAKMSKASS